ncbi:hypothetical protein LCGC14_1227050 [marine sediment metagenome]|uniref:Uncharacterized protein n=1 Tax=marine sediment metagenome TaxID=412755 RepID=A0A0F9LDP6_9ZZZZ
MTKRMNRQSRVTERRKGALQRLELGVGVKSTYFNKDKEIATLREKIDSAPQGMVGTKKTRGKPA